MKTRSIPVWKQPSQVKSLGWLSLGLDGQHVDSLRGLTPNIYDVVCISPRNHMVFTHLLSSTCVGTLEFRSVAEPVSWIQSALAQDPNSYFYLATCTDVDTDKHEVYCETVGDAGLPHEHYRFKVAYDKLVIAAGSEPLTFGIKGVKEHAYFLREVYHAQEIRKKLLLNLMLSQNPAWSESTGRGEASESICLSLAFRSWCNGRNLLCAGSNLHVAQGSDCSKGYAYLKSQKKIWRQDGTKLPLPLSWRLLHMPLKEPNWPFGCTNMPSITQVCNYIASEKLLK